MRLYANADGGLLRATPGVEVGAPTTRLWPPFAGTVETLDFDDDTNGPLVEALVANTAPYRLSGGALTKDGTPVTIAPPGRFIQDRDQIQQALGQLDTFLESLDGGTNLTAAQVQQAIKFLLRFARYVLRWIVRRG
jgi:hypothetical protein